MNLKEQFNGIQHSGIPTNDIVHFLPFWENGVKFFTIEGPNKEKVENMFREMIAGPGAVRATIHKYIG